MQLLQDQTLLIISKPGVQLYIYLYVRVPIVKVSLLYLNPPPVNLVFHDKTNDKNLINEMIYHHCLIRSGVCVRITVSLGGPYSKAFSE